MSVSLKISHSDEPGMGKDMDMMKRRRATRRRNKLDGTAVIGGDNDPSFTVIGCGASIACKS